MFKYFKDVYLKCKKVVKLPKVGTYVGTVVINNCHNTGLTT